MAHNIFFNLLLFIFILGFLIDLIIDLLNYSHSTKQGANPNEKGLNYFRDNFKISFCSSLLATALILMMLFSGTFGKLDNYLTEHFTSIYGRAVLYFAILGIGADLIFLPISIYKTFGIEARYGFNKTTAVTFVSDKIKSLLVGSVIGGVLLCFILWIYHKDPAHFWLFAWLTVSGFIIFMSMFFTTVLLPVFNKLTPLQESDLKDAIIQMCTRLNFPLAKLYIMDGSKRSTKANAFFSGLGPKKTIVLYDTLVNNYSKDEILAVLAHEIGHYKLKHTQKTLFVSLLQTAIMFYLLSLFLGNKYLAEALGTSQASFEICLTGFAILYSPVSELLSFLLNSLSRKHEYEADNYAKVNFNGRSLADALEKLHKDSLSNPNPHPVYVAVHYSHPTLKQRVARLI
jgi:STE24 endopeptidase